ncbi:hypothetical protein OG429_39450 [Streptomyces sp. NBC_00190]|uniref:hypothetical protein n=1 Tax=unclassified Streptomyces TaxID=2593676 RepID=UPI002E2D59F8|nr:hypothetical protein [Streptomyces sp. NBC_00190]
MQKLRTAISAVGVAAAALAFAPSTATAQTVSNSLWTTGPGVAVSGTYEWRGASKNIFWIESLTLKNTGACDSTTVYVEIEVSGPDDYYLKNTLGCGKSVRDSSISLQAGYGVNVRVCRGWWAPDCSGRFIDNPYNKP